MKEYQPVRDAGRVLPREIYYECIWIVRDMARMQEIVNRTGYEGREFEVARDRLECINKALMAVPPEYRRGVMASIENRGGRVMDYAHENTWKKYKQRFVYNLAKNLALY